MGVSALVWWIRREVSRLDTCIGEHDDFVNTTKDVLTDVKVDLASIKANITSMDHSLGDLAKSNRDVTKYMIEKRT